MNSEKTYEDNGYLSEKKKRERLLRKESKHRNKRKNVLNVNSVQVTILSHFSNMNNSKLLVFL